MINSNHPPKKIIIIGAGLAGLSAAKRLQNSNYQILVLEARNHIGGRIKTLKSQNGDIHESGANWLHHFDQNHPLFHLIQNQPSTELLYEINLTDFLSFNGLKKIHRQSKKILLKNLLNIPSLLYSYFFIKRIELKNFALLREIGLKKFPALKTILLTLYADYLPTDFNHQPSGLIPPLNGAACSLSFTTNDEYFLSSGMDKILTNFPYSNIQMNAQVQKISFNEKQVHIFYNQGGKQQEILADYVINALPLGVLKNKKVVFSPELSQEKQYALSRLKMIHVRKFALTFKKEVFARIAQDNKNLYDKRYFYFFDHANDDVFWFINLNGIKNAVHQDNHIHSSTFVIYITGKQYQRYSSHSTLDLTKVLLNILNSEFHHFTDDDILETHDKDWGTDEFSYGAYSYISTGGSMNDRAVLNNPEYEGRMIFAGEHVVCGNMRGLAAAYQSGIYAAEKILNLE